MIIRLMLLLLLLVVRSATAQKTSLTDAGVHYVVPPGHFVVVSHGMAWVMMFRPQDRLRFAQSPSGGDAGNPAWDFQAFVSPYEVTQVYRVVVRAMYVPFALPEQLRRLCRPHLIALENQD